jgi:hypothetical protein
MVGENTLAYYDTTTITTLKMFHCKGTLAYLKLERSSPSFQLCLKFNSVAGGLPKRSTFHVFPIE